MSPARRRHLVSAALATLLIGRTGQTVAQPAAEHEAQSRPLIVAVAETPPFAMKNDDGSWSGLSVDLWREVAAERDLHYELREVDLEQAARLLGDRSVDVAIGAIAVSAEGEATHDFSQPYLATGLGLAEATTGEPSWRSALGALMSSQLLHVILLIGVATVLVGILIAFIERRHNADQFGGSLRRGIATGVWWAAVTMTTVGYGDATPKTASGRSVALVWMFVGVVAVAIFTATVTSILTVGSLQSTVQRTGDLDRLRLGAVRGAAGELFLTQRHLSFAAFETYEEALGALAGKKLDAVVANRTGLRYLVRRDWQGVLRVSPLVLEPVLYAFGLQTGSPLREPIDQTLLGIIEQRRWEDIEHLYLGNS